MVRGETYGARVARRFCGEGAVEGCAALSESARARREEDGKYHDVVGA